MGIADLKARMRDVPGIDSLTMQIQGGQQVFNLNGRPITFGAGESDAAVEAGIRAAVASPAIVQMAAGAPVTPDMAQAAAVALHPTVAAAVSPAPAPTSSANPAAAHTTVKQMMADHASKMAELHAGMTELLRAALSEQQNTVATALGNVTSQIKGQTDDFKAMMGQFTNLEI